MRIPGTWIFSSIKEVKKENLRRMLDEVSSLFEILQQAMNGNITFGDATDIDNIKGLWLSFTSDAVANTEFTVTHNLGQIPTGFLDVGYKDKAGVLYRGVTPWTTTAIFLKCNVASTTCRVFILLGPEAQ